MYYCPNCGEEVSESANFCPNCGRELDFGSEKISSKKTSQKPDEKFKSAKLDEREEEMSKKLRVNGIIGNDENVLAYTRRPRYKSTVNPASLIVTDRQIIYYDPGFIGSNIETRRIDEIQDIAIDSGLKNATITIRSIAMDDLEFKDFPKDDVKNIRDVVRRIS